MSAATGPLYVQPARRPDGTWRSPGYRSARLRARGAYISFACLLISSIALVTQRWAQWDVLDRVIGGRSFTVSEAYAADNGVSAWTGLYVLFSIAAMVTFLAWLSRSVENAPPLLSGTPTRSPRESIGWWFVPFASFVVPYQMVRELFERLATPNRRGRGAAVIIWWILFVCANLSAVLPAMASSETDPTLEQAQSVAAMWLITELANVVGLCFALWLIHEIQSRADIRAAGLHLSADGVPVWPTPPPPPQSAVPSTPPLAVAQTAIDDVAFCSGCGLRRQADARYCGGCGRGFGLTAASQG